MKEGITYVGQGLPSCQYVEMMKGLEIAGPRCQRCKGTVIKDLSDSRYSYCFQCGRQYRFGPGGRIVPRWK